VEVVADGLGAVRALAFAPDGRLFASRPSDGEVLTLADSDGDGSLDRRIVFASGLNEPFGLAFDAAGALYVAENGRLLRFPGAATAPRGGKPEVVTDLVGGGGHTTRSVVVAPSGRLFVAAGSSCNVCVERDRRRAAVVEVDPASGKWTLFAEGLRNTVGLAIHPKTGELWGADNGRDWLGDDLPPEEINIIRRGRHYGWPSCWGDRVPDREAPRDRAPAPPTPDFCASTEPPVVKIQAHSAPLGLAFYTESRFPPEYRGDLFVTLHGSWNRSVPTGYKVVRVRVTADGRPEGPTAVEDFVTGWLVDGRVSGRPVGIAVGPDGALYVSDDRGGRTYRVSYASD
jgi:glucose/arabinose dehydrogenase